VTVQEAESAEWRAMPVCGSSVSRMGAFTNYTDVAEFWPEHQGHLLVYYETVCSTYRPLTMAWDEETQEYHLGSSHIYIDQTPAHDVMADDHSYQFADGEEQEPSAHYVPTHGMEVKPGEPWAYPVLLHQEIACLTCGVALWLPLVRKGPAILDRDLDHP
jgi:hypothetical protein